MLVLALGHALVAAEQPTQPAAMFPLEVMWTAALSTPAAAWPAYDKVRAYVPLRSGKLVAVSLADGQIVWSADRATHLMPATGDASVFVADGEAVHALDGSGGSVRWRLDLASPMSAPLLWDTGWLIVGLENGQILALRGKDGRQIWQRQLSGAMRVTPSIVGERLVVPVEDGHVLALTLETGEHLWDQKLGGSPAPILAVDDLFVGSTDNFLYCLSRRDGRVKWYWRTGADIVGPPVVDDQRVYFVSLDNVLRALDRRSGVQRWRRSLAARAAAGPRHAGNLLLVAGVSPSLRFYDPSTGEPARAFESPAELAAPPHVFDDPRPDGPLLVLLTGDGQLLGLRRGVGPPLVPLDYQPGWVPEAEPPLVPLESIPGTLLPLPPHP